MPPMHELPATLLRVFGWTALLTVAAGPIILGGVIAPFNALAGALVAGAIIETMPKSPGPDAG